MRSEELNEELKYLDYLGLRYNPFPVAPDVENFYMCENIERIVTEIGYGVATRKGFMVFTGEIGLGKTTISRKLINMFEEKGVETSLVFHTFYQETELLREINRDFGLRAERLVFSDQMKVLNDFLLSQNQKGKNCAIIIDDAQNLDHKSLELIRMISNLETDREKLVQILLIGQPELMDKLNSPGLWQLRSRIMIREEAKPLSQEELRNYVLFKLNMAGNTGKISIKKDAIKRIHKLTGGNFRQVNVLMERCLYVLFLNNTAEIRRKIVSEAQRDLYPQEPMSMKRSLAWGLLATLILYLAGSAFLPQVFFKLPWIEPNAHVNFSVINNTIRDKGLLPQSGSTFIPKKVPVSQGGEACAEETERDRRIPEAVSNFLSSYGLSDFGSVFFDALEAKKLREVADSIFEDTGYQMVELDRVPPNIRNHYGTLSLYAWREGEGKYLLFWRPKIKVTKFYLGYEGEEIRSLQELLAAGGFYRCAIDGIVGPKLVAALNRLQDAGGLNITGFPDEKTIFVLCHTSGDRRS